MVTMGHERDDRNPVRRRWGLPDLGASWAKPNSDRDVDGVSWGCSTLTVTAGPPMG
jgi:hypothetical protein